MIYADCLAGDQRDLKAAQQKPLPQLCIESEPPDVAGIFLPLFNIIGDALRKLRRASIKIVIEVDVNPHVVRPISRYAVVQENRSRLEAPIDGFVHR